MFHNGANYSHRKNDTTPKYALYSGFMHNQWGEKTANTGDDDGKVTVFVFFPIAICIDTLNAGYKGLEFLHLLLTEL